jgi:hypothetical protein
MFLVKANTVIQIQVPKSETHFNWLPWRPYTTKEDKFYDKSEVWDMVAVYNGREDVPEWAWRNITEHGVTVIVRSGKYALVKNKDVVFVD